PRPILRNRLALQLGRPRRGQLKSFYSAERAMSTDDLGVVQGSRIRPLGKFLIGAGVVVSVGVLIYALFTQGMNWTIPPDTDSGRSRIDLNALHDIPPEI